MIHEPILLASASPRRRELLQLAGIPFTVAVSGATELTDASVCPEELVTENAKRKASDVSSRFPGKTVLGADTVVVVNGKILGKPASRDDARRMLTLLSGNTHEVMTGICLTDGTRVKTDCTVTRVRFFPLTKEEIDTYVSTGECDDKAGAYGIQGKGCTLVESIDGDYYSIVGLPIGKVYKFLRAFWNEMPIDTDAFSEV